MLSCFGIDGILEEEADGGMSRASYQTVISANGVRAVSPLSLVMVRGLMLLAGETIKTNNLVHCMPERVACNCSLMLFTEASRARTEGQDISVQGPRV